MNPLISEEVPKTLSGGAKLLQAPVELVPQAAWSFIETLLLGNDLLLIVHRREAPCLVAVVSSTLAKSRMNLKQGSLWLEREELDFLEQRPAVLATSLVRTPHLNARQLVNSLRGLMMDIAIQGMVPAGGSRLVILISPGGVLLDLVKTVEEMDAAQAERLADEQREIGDAK